MLYEVDFYGWTQDQFKALANKNIAALDWENLQKEIESLGKQEYRELVSRLTVLIGHLLKWDYQPDLRSRSWFLTIREQRRAIDRHLRRNPSLKSRLDDALEDSFEAGLDLALRETNLPIRTFPIQCPYDFQSILDHTFLCETDRDWNFDT